MKMKLQIKLHSMKTILICIIVIFASVSIFSQNISVSGQVADTSGKKPLGKANVIFAHLPDLKIKGIIADNNGRFKIDNLTPGKYLLTVSFLGYKSYKRNIDIDRVIDLPKIYLIPEGLEMHEIDIIGKTSGVIDRKSTRLNSSHLVISYAVFCL